MLLISPEDAQGPFSRAKISSVTGVGEWLELQADRVSARQRAQVETAKLVTTFVTAVAATLCGSDIQVPGNDPLEVAALVGLGIAALLTLIVFASDRLAEAPHKELLSRAHTQGWNGEKLLRELRTAAIDAVESNQEVVRIVKLLTAVQVLTAAASGTLAVLALQL